MTRRPPMQGGIVADDFFQHPKVVKCSDAAIAAWVKGLSWVARKRSNGRISVAATKHLKMSESGVVELEKARLWDPHPDGGWVFHNYTKRNRTDEEKAADREAGKARAAKSRANAKEERSAERSQVLPPEQDDADALATVYEIRPTRFCERVGAAWFKALTGEQPDKGWAPELGRIGQKPERERDLVAKHVRETSFLQNEDGNITVSPKHVLLYWGDYIRGPKGSSQIKPTVSTRAPGMPSSKSEIGLMTVPEWARAEAE